MEADKQKDRKVTRAEISVEADRILIEQMQRLETIAKKGSMQVEPGSQGMITKAMCDIADRLRCPGYTA